jgi:putative PIN family toxin of toxin-antitoxin system
MRLVLDTDVILSSLRSPTGASRVLLIAAWEGVITLLAGVATMVEYEAVLKRPEHLVEMGLDTGDVDVFLDNIAALCEPVFPDFSYRPSIRDPDDEIFVEVALNGAADAIVTFNVKDYLPSDPATGSLGIAVCRPGDILRRLSWRPSTDTLSAFRPRSWTR